MAEDEAARRIGAALVPDPAGQRISLAAPFTGRCNLFAEAAGLFRVDPGTVRALNAIDEGIAFATLADNALVAARQMLGTIKIIPLRAAGRRSGAGRGASPRRAGRCPCIPWPPVRRWCCSRARPA